MKWGVAIMPGIFTACHLHNRKVCTETSKCRKLSLPALLLEQTTRSAWFTIPSSPRPLNT